MGGLKMLSKNTCEGVHLIVKLPAISLQACKFNENELLHTHFPRILARFEVIIYCAFSRRFNGGGLFFRWGALVLSGRQGGVRPMGSLMGGGGGGGGVAKKNRNMEGPPLPMPPPPPPLWKTLSFMGVFRVIYNAQIAPNRKKHHIFVHHLVNIQLAILNNILTCCILSKKFNFGGDLKF